MTYMIGYLSLLATNRTHCDLKQKNLINLQQPVGLNEYTPF